MTLNSQLIQRLNLIRSSPSFVLKEIGDEGEHEVLSIKIIPKDSGNYWVGGTTKIKNGTEFDSVFIIDTNSGGSLIQVYWFINEQWFEQDSSLTLTELSLSKSDVFPYDWRYAIELEKDIYH